MDTQLSRSPRLLRMRQRTCSYSTAAAGGDDRLSSVYRHTRDLRCGVAAGRGRPTLVRVLLTAFFAAAVMVALIVLEALGVGNSALQRTIILVPLAIVLVLGALMMRNRF